MPFCTNCGTRVEVESSFCAGCGKPLGNGTRTMAAVAPTAEPLDYTIQGESVQVVRIRLKPGQEVIAGSGRMVYKFPEVQRNGRVNGASGGEKMEHFRAPSPSEVGFAGAYPGRIQAFELKAGQSLLVERDGLVCAQSTAHLDVALTKRLGAGLSGGEEFILERLTGPGTVFIHAGGDFVEFVLNPGQALDVDTVRIVAFEDSVGYEMQAAGEDPRQTKLTGPGRVVVQSMTPEKLRRRGEERADFEAACCETR